MDKQLAVCQEKILALARLFHIDPFQPEDEVRSHSRALSLARVMAGTMELVVLSRGAGWGWCSKRVGAIDGDPGLGALRRPQRRHPARLEPRRTFSPLTRSWTTMPTSAWRAHSSLSLYLSLTLAARLEYVRRSWRSQCGA